jgi:small basic protein
MKGGELVITKKLEMSFQNANGGKVTLSVLDPLDDLVEGDVRAAMQNIIDKNIFESTGGDLVRIVGARIVSTEVAELIAS